MTVSETGSFSWTFPMTIGVAITVPEPFAAELEAFRERFGDPLAHAIAAHVTLLPPTTLSDLGALARVEDHLLGVATRHKPYTVTLAGSESFRPVSPVVFVPLVEGFYECSALADDVRSGPLHRDLMFPYHPHVTIAHDVAQEWLDEAEYAMGDYRASFPVDGFGLYEHAADGVWRSKQFFHFSG